MNSLSSYISPDVFKAIEKSDIERLSLCTENDIRPILPCLVRMSLIAPLDHSQQCIKGRKIILRVLSGIEAVNALVALLSIDFTSLEADFKREQSLRQKLGTANQNENLLVQGLANGLALEFECSDPTRRLRLLLSELLLVFAHMKEPRTQFYKKPSELFDNDCYIEEVSDVLCIALAELPYLLSPLEVAEALLHLNNGPSIICKMVANQPDCFREVVHGLIFNGEKIEDEGIGVSIRMKAVRLLCLMNPSQALSVRGLCIDHCTMPALVIYISLDAAKSSGNHPEIRPNKPETSKTITKTSLETITRTSPEDITRTITKTSPEDITRTITKTSPEDITKTIQEGSSGTIRKTNRKAIPEASPEGITKAIPEDITKAITETIPVAEELDMVSFMTGILLSTDQRVKMWFAQFMKNALRGKQVQYSTALIALRAELSNLLNKLLVTDSSNKLLESNITQATALLRLYCALKSIANIKFSEDTEIDTLVRLIITLPPNTSSGVRFVITGLCMVISCPSLIGSEDNERKVGDWIKWLVKEEDYFKRASDSWFSSLGSMLLLLAIHFHVQQISSVIDLVSSALGMRVTLSGAGTNRANNISKIKYIFTHDVFTEQVVTSHAVRVSVTKNLNAKFSGFLPVHCIYHQLKNKMFIKHRVPIKHWIYRQVCSCTTPLHSVMPQLLEAFVNSILLPASKSTSVQQGFNEPFSEDEVMAVFALSSFSTKGSKTKFSEQKVSASVTCNSPPDITCVVTSQLLLLYYLLLYEDTRLMNMQQIQHCNRDVLLYSPHLFAQLPIRFLLSRAQADQNLYAGVFSSLLELLITHYPQLCLVEDWIYHKLSLDHSHHLAIFNPRITLNLSSLAQAMQEADENPGYILVLMDHMLKLPSRDLWVFAPTFVSGIKSLLKPSVSRKVLDTYKLVWLKLNSLFPRRLWAMTVEGLRPDNDKLSTRLKLSEDDIILDPLYVFRCDQRVFRCAPILEIMIYIVEVYLLSSRAFLTQHSLCSATAQPNTALESEREKLKCALVLAQESAVVQILLETTSDQNKTGIGREFILQEIRSIVCSFLHQAFIKDTTLAKLVHFQGYSTDMIGPIVEGVPSMHIAIGLNWIPELLQLPELDKRIFALNLTSHLTLQYAMPSTFSIARLMINSFLSLLTVLTQEEKLTLIEFSIESLARIGHVFPSLLDDIVHLLVNFGKVVLAKNSFIDGPSPKSHFCLQIEDKNDGETTPFELKNLKLKNVSIRQEKLTNEVKKSFQSLIMKTASKRLY